MSPAQAIAALDRQLARHGESVVVITGTAEAGVRAFVRGFKPDELTGDIHQGDRSVILSPTGLSFVPARNGAVKIAGKRFNVESVETVRMADVIVRHNLVVRG